jgi:hypothetical protein
MAQQLLCRQTRQQPMKPRTMNGSESRLKALQDDLERSLVIARALRAKLAAKTEHMNRRALDPVAGVARLAPRVARIRARA